MQEQTNIAIYNTSTSALTTSIFYNTSVMEAVREYVDNNQGFTIMNSIKGTPAY